MCPFDYAFGLQILIKCLHLCALAGSACTMSEYNKLKSTLLDMQPKALKTAEQNQQRDMEEKRGLVDAMFKYLDVNQDGRLIADELEKVSLKLNRCTHSKWMNA